MYIYIYIYIGILLYITENPVTFSDLILEI